MYRDDVREGYCTLEVVYELNVQRIGLLLRNVRVVCDDLHVEGVRALGYLAADSPEPNDKQTPVTELTAEEFIPLPLAAVKRRAGLRYAADDGEHVRHSELRRG